MNYQQQAQEEMMGDWESKQVCEACGGEGWITFNPSPINDPQCEEQGRCADCGGDGSL